MRRCPSTTSVSLATAWSRSCACALDGLVGPSLRFLSGRLHQCLDHVGVDAPVPRVQGRGRRNVGQGVGVGQRDPFGRVLAVRVVEALGPGRHREAGTETLEIPLPRSGQCLVEVVDIEDQPPLGRGEPSEVDEMGVPAQLHGNLRRRRPGKVRRHDGRSTTVETERRLCHAPVADRQQVLDTVLTLALEDRHWIRSILRRRPLPVDHRGTSSRERPPPSPAIVTINRARTTASSSERGIRCPHQCRHAVLRRLRRFLQCRALLLRRCRHDTPPGASLCCAPQL